MSPSPGELVIGITGASGAAYATRLIEILLGQGRTVHVVISPSGAQVIQQELGITIDLEHLDPALFGKPGPGRLIHHSHRNLAAGIASGSFRTAGMVIVPCSMSTLGLIAGGISTNLISRAAGVHLKEKRPLILVPRETPLSVIHLENMTRVAQAGALVLPAAPGWYNNPRTLADLVDFVVARILDQLGVEHSLSARWGESHEGGKARS